MKYVIVELARKEKQPRASTLPKWPILFSDAIVHADVVPQGCVAVSAGEVSLHTVGSRLVVSCSGKSETLAVSSHPNADAQLILGWFLTGESMMVLAGEDWEREAAEEAKDEAAGKKKKK